MKDRMSIADRYIVTMRIIQPARVQDVYNAYLQLWGDNGKNHTKELIYILHDKMRSEGLLVDVRKGTYLLSERGMRVAAKLIKEREIDNRRLFLMKRQRRLYH